MTKRTSGNAYATERKLTGQSTRQLRIQEQAQKDYAAELSREARKLWKARREAEKKSV